MISLICIYNISENQVHALYFFFFSFHWTTPKKMTLSRYKTHSHICKNISGVLTFVSYFVFFVGWITLCKNWSNALSRWLCWFSATSWKKQKNATHRCSRLGEFRIQVQLVGSCRSDVCRQSRLAYQSRLSMSSQGRPSLWGGRKFTLL